MSGLSNSILATSVFLSTLAGLGAGYLMAPPPARSGDSRPIIDPDAWNKTAPTLPAFQAQLTTSPVAVNIDIVAEDLKQRGWIPPDDAKATNYEEEIPAVDTSDASYAGSYSVEQLDGASSGDTAVGEADPTDRGSSSIQVLDKADADRAWASQPSATFSEQ